MITLSLRLASFWSCKLKGKLGDTLMTTITCYITPGGTPTSTLLIFFIPSGSKPCSRTVSNTSPCQFCVKCFEQFYWNRNTLWGALPKASDYSLNTASKKVTTVTESGEKKPWVMHPAWGTRLSFLSETSERSRSNSQHIWKKKPKHWRGQSIEPLELWATSLLGGLRSLGPWDPLLALSSF